MKTSVRIEPPDVTFWTFVGDVSEVEMRALTAIEKARIQGAPYILKLVDMTRTGRVSAGARKAGAEKIHDVPVLGVAIFGASFPIRIIAELTVRAGNYIRKINDLPTRFFATENEARGWLAARRDEIASRAP